MKSDTIVALISGPPPCAVALVRLSGPDARRIAGRVFVPKSGSLRSRFAKYGRYASGDDGYGLLFEEGASFTGEETVELSLHGGRASVEALINDCIRIGARSAEPGEFTQRAFLSGRIDLSQAEAIADTVEALTARQLTVASEARKGGLFRAVSELREKTLGLLALVEATIDFSEEIGELDFLDLHVQLSEVADGLRLILRDGRCNRIVRDGLRVAIVGRPNAGKSALFNALAGADRAIVTSTPGTTRDTVEEIVDFYGIPVRLVDTAGLRETEDQIESLGIARTQRAAAVADEVWYVFDSAVGWTEEDATEVDKLPFAPRLISNKCDLSRSSTGHQVSALTGEGLDQLVGAVAGGYGENAVGYAINLRQDGALGRAESTLQDALQAVESDHPPDLIATLLMEIASSLGRVTGETVDGGVLDEIFSRFCIGK